MAEEPRQERLQIRVIGIYIIVILILLRFLVYPLPAAIQEKKTLLVDLYETYRLKSQVQERQKADQGQKPSSDKDPLLLRLYDKGIPYSNIQSDIIEQIIKTAGEKGLTVINFEILEPGVGKDVSELPVVVRMKGAPGPLIEILETIEKSEKVLSVRSMEIAKSGQDQTFSLTLSAFRLER